MRFDLPRGDIKSLPDGSFERWNPAVGRWVQERATERSAVVRSANLVAIEKASAPVSLSSVYGRGGNWISVFDNTPNGQDRDRPPGAFQSNNRHADESILSYNPVYACITLIANDMAKLRQCLMQEDGDGVLQEVTSPSFSPVLRRPNQYQNHIQFKQWWTMSKLDNGNTYALKERDARGVVVGLYILNPRRCKPMVAPDGSVYYQLGEDIISGVQEAVIVPSSEIIHDRMNCLFHPLVGTSPLYAAALAAQQGLGIQSDSLTFFANGSNPGGVLTAPGTITDAVAKRARDYWETNFSGRQNAGKVAVLGDGLHYEAMRMNSAESQASDQLSMSARFVCSAFHVPLFKVGLEEIPRGEKVSDLNQIYYDDCLQSLIEEYEQCLMDGLGLDYSSQYSISLDLDGLLRMDPGSQITMLSEAVKGSVMAPNEARRRVNLGPIDGGNTVYLQQQNYSLAALAKRDQSADPFATAPPAAPTAPVVDNAPAKAIEALQAKLDRSDETVRQLLDAVLEIKSAANVDRQAREQASVEQQTQMDRAAASEADAAAMVDALVAKFTDAARTA